MRYAAKVLYKAMAKCCSPVKLDPEGVLADLAANGYTITSAEPAAPMTDEKLREAVITMRDHMAMAALAMCQTATPETVAAYAYDIADSMLAARQKGDADSRREPMSEAELEREAYKLATPFLSVTEAIDLAKKYRG